MTSFADKPTIAGNHVLLRPLVAADAPAMWLDLHDDEANRLTGTHSGITRAQVDDWCASRDSQHDRLDLAVVDPSTGAWLGEVVVNEWDQDNRSCSFRIALSAQARGRGVGTEATQMIVDYVFEELGVNRLELEVYAFNPRAIAVYERVGFKTEGRRRQALCWDGEFVDAILMSIVRSDRQAS